MSAAQTSKKVKLLMLSHAVMGGLLGLEKEKKKESLPCQIDPAAAASSGSKA